MFAGSAVAVSGVMSISRSRSLPLWKTAPLRTRATRCGAFYAPASLRFEGDDLARQRHQRITVGGNGFDDPLLLGESCIGEP